MTRVLSGAVLVALAVAVVWFAPPWLFFAVGFVLAVLAVNEVVALAQASGLAVSTSAAGFAARAGGRQRAAFPRCSRDRA